MKIIKILSLFVIALLASCNNKVATIEEKKAEIEDKGYTVLFNRDSDIVYMNEDTIFNYNKFGVTQYEPISDVVYNYFQLNLHKLYPMEGDLKYSEYPIGLDANKLSKILKSKNFIASNTEGIVFSVESIDELSGQPIKQTFLFNAEYNDSIQFTPILTFLSNQEPIEVDSNAVVFRNHTYRFPHEFNVLLAEGLTDSGLTEAIEYGNVDLSSDVKINLNGSIENIVPIDIRIGNVFVTIYGYGDYDLIEAIKQSL